MLLLVLVLGACAGAPRETELTWDGHQVTGLTFYERVMEHVTVHYALPTYPDTAERAAMRADSQARVQKSMGRIG